MVVNWLIISPNEPNFSIFPVRTSKLIEKEKRIAEEEARIAREKQMRSQKIENSKPSRGGYCSIHCRHYHEEFLDSYGGIVGDFDSGGYVEYYCSLGHSISHGSYCKDYE